MRAGAAKEFPVVVSPPTAGLISAVKARDPEKSDDDSDRDHRVEAISEHRNSPDRDACPYERFGHYPRSRMLLICSKSRFLKSLDRNTILSISARERSTEEIIKKNHDYYFIDVLHVFINKI